MSDGTADDFSAETPPKPRLTERLKRLILKPPKPGEVTESPEPNEPLTLEEVKKTVPADDRERFIGLIAAPVAALISILIIGSLINRDPAATFANGRANAAHVNPSLYHELLFVLLGLSILMVVTAWFRKRLYLGIVLALYGLAVFNLHFWGFGVPFLLVGAWYLVSAYRVQQSLRALDGEEPSRFSRRGRSQSDQPSLPRAEPNKRYTPPTRRPKKLPAPQPEEGDVS